jgi:hypothetical protein
MTSIRLFVCFDSGHDLDLHALFGRQCVAPGSTLDMVDWSRDETPHARWEDKLRERLAGVDAVVVLCGEGTGAAANVGREFGMVQETKTPYVLLWGRRSGMCTRPALSPAHDHFYAWTWGILNEQVRQAIRQKQDPLGIERATLLGLRSVKASVKA